MAIPQHLRVIGSRSIFRFLIPPEGKPFRSSEFLLVEPANAGAVFRELPDDDSLTVVVDPDNYEIEALNRLPGLVWLWFLRPIGHESSSSSSVAPNLARIADEALATRRNFLERVVLGDSSAIVVSDEESFEYCSHQGNQVLLSPPPVSDDVAEFPSANQTVISVWTQGDSTEYLRKFLEELPPQVVMGEGLLLSETESPKIPTHWVVPQDTFTQSFPYEAAMAVVAGQTLISGVLSPRWGLEPGLDYLEYSTPEELRRIVEHNVRYPHSTQLMAWRGKLKSTIFLASQVYPRLLSSLD
jgi:hypothetical protein